MGLTIPLNTLMGAPSKALFLLTCSSAVRPRRPFAKDPELTYDFEVDSEDEWEDEAEGENLSVRCAGASQLNTCMPSKQVSLVHAGCPDRWEVPGLCMLVEHHLPELHTQASAGTDTLHRSLRVDAHGLASRVMTWTKTGWGRHVHVLVADRRTTGLRRLCIPAGC